MLLLAEAKPLLVATERDVAFAMPAEAGVLRPSTRHCSD
jgi:hypothetical protein